MNTTQKAKFRGARLGGTRIVRGLRLMNNVRISDGLVLDRDLLVGFTMVEGQKVIVYVKGDRGHDYTDTGVCRLVEVAS